MLLYFGANTVQFGKWTPGGFRGAYPLHFYKRGLRVEIVRQYSNGANFRPNINPVCSWVPIGLARRIDVPRRELVLTE
jgi:hypothetical protein